MLLTVSQSSWVTRPCLTISSGLSGTSWSAALVVGVTTLASNLHSSQRSSLYPHSRLYTPVPRGCAPLVTASIV